MVSSDVPRAKSKSWAIERDTEAQNFDHLLLENNDAN